MENRFENSDRRQFLGGVATVVAGLGLGVLSCKGSSNKVSEEVEATLEDAPDTPREAFEVRLKERGLEVRYIEDDEMKENGCDPFEDTNPYLVTMGEQSKLVHIRVVEPKGGYRYSARVDLGWDESFEELSQSQNCVADGGDACEGGLTPKRAFELNSSRLRSFPGRTEAGTDAADYVANSLF